MTNEKNEDSKKSDKANGDWEFSIAEDETQLKVDQTNKSKNNKNFVDMYEKKIKQQNKKLSLDEPAVPKTKTRSAMSLEVEAYLKKPLEDDFEKASLIKRFLAFVIDCAFMAGIVYIAQPLSILLRSVIQSYMDNYKLKFNFPDPIMAKIFLGITIFVFILSFVVTPVSFFNTSLGKKILGLKVRDIDTNTVTLKQAFKREVVMKPISLLIVVGLFVPLFTKKRQGLHDFATETVVVEAD